jgi:hypothetical protein
MTIKYRTLSIFAAAVAVAGAVGLSACSEDSATDTDGGTTADSGTKTDGATTTDSGTKTDGATGGDAAAKSFCERLGGATAINGVVDSLVTGLAGDCRISKHFTELPQTGLTHVSDCLKNQLRAVYGCVGSDGKAEAYDGSKDANGNACKSMKDSHAGLGISGADFTALIEVAVGVLDKAGVKSGDPDTGDIFSATASALTSDSMKADIITATSPEAGLTKTTCVADAGGGG